MIRLFRHYVPLLAVFIAGCEILLFVAVIAGLEKTYLADYLGVVSSGSGYLVMAFWIAVVVVLVMSSVGLYNRDVMFRMDAVVTRIGVTFPLSFVVLYGTLLSFSFILRGDFVLRHVIVASIPACGVAALLVHGASARLLNSDKFKRRLLIVGSGRMAHKAEQLATAQRQFAVVGFVESGDEEPSLNLSPVFPSAALRTPERAIELIRANDIDEIVVATSERRGLPVQSLLECRMRGIDVQDFASFCESEAGYIDLDDLQPAWLIFNDGFRMTRGRQFIKACFDYVLAALLLLLTLPITLPTALAIKLTSRGPVFFRQERVGRNNKVFAVLKFRSMVVDAEKAGPQWAQANDRRVTVVGRVIRKVRIDEIPQVINVMRGEMSFIGPRPERPYFVQSLSEVIPYFKERHRVKPGITGWAQINYPYGASVEDSKNKLAYDFYYLKNGGIFLDLVILFQTVRVILWPFGAR